MRFTESHEWVEIKGEIASIGLTARLKEELKDVVYIELPQVGTRVKKGEEVVIIESTKAASDIYSPLTGVITRVNEELKAHPEKIQEGVFVFEIRIEKKEELEELLIEECVL